MCDATEAGLYLLECREVVKLASTGIDRGNWMVLMPRNSSNRCQLLRYDDLVLLELAADRRDSAPVFRWTADRWVQLLPFDPAMEPLTGLPGILNERVYQQGHFPYLGYEPIWNICYSWELLTLTYNQFHKGRLTTWLLIDNLDHSLVIRHKQNLVVSEVFSPKFQC